MYSHDAQRFNCDKCDFTCHFESELLTHKISHRKTPTHQYMTAYCGHWFKCKWELTIHVCTHEEGSFKYDECDYTAKIEKHLKEHKKRHMDDLPYHCKACDKHLNDIGIKTTSDKRLCSVVIAIKETLTRYLFKKYFTFNVNTLLIL